VFYPFAIDQRIKTGRATLATVSAAIEAKGIRFEPVDSRTSIEWAERRLFAQMR
jgi:hypothetical protein